MKQYLLIFAALLSINAQAQITITRAEVTPNSISMTLSGKIPADAIEPTYLDGFIISTDYGFSIPGLAADDFNKILHPDVVDTEIPVPEIELTAMPALTVFYYEGMPAYFIGENFGTHIYVSLEQDIIKNQHYDLTITITYSQNIFIPENCNGLNFQWGIGITDDYGTRVAATTHIIIPENVTTPALTTALSGGNIQITIPTEPGKSYQLQNSAALDSFSNLGAAVSGDGNPHTFTDPADQDAEFYRVEIIDNP